MKEPWEVELARAERDTECIHGLVSCDCCHHGIVDEDGNPKPKSGARPSAGDPQ